MSVASERGGNAKPVLLCYDGSEDARRAVAVAASLLGRRNAVVLDIGPIEMVAGDYIALDPDAMRVDHLVAEDALARATAGAELASDADFRAEARSDVDSPTWSGIVDVADKLDAAVIVIGSRGLSGLNEVVEGRLSHEVAEHAGRPVLIAPPTRRGRQESAAVTPHPFGHVADAVRPRPGRR
jgi:nucleotide-binding universal stress UspA family protein